MLYEVRKAWSKPALVTKCASPFPPSPSPGGERGSGLQAGEGGCLHAGHRQEGGRQVWASCYSGWGSICTLACNEGCLAAGVHAMQPPAALLHRSPGACAVLSTLPALDASSHARVPACRLTKPVSLAPTFNCPQQGRHRHPQRRRLQAGHHRALRDDPPGGNGQLGRCWYVQPGPMQPWSPRWACGWL